MKKITLLTSILALFTSASFADIIIYSGQHEEYSEITKVYTDNTAYGSQKYMVYNGASVVVEGDISVSLVNYTGRANADFIAGIIKQRISEDENGKNSAYDKEYPSIVVKGTIYSTIDGSGTNVSQFYGGNGGNVDNALSTVGGINIVMNDGHVGSMRIAGGATNSVVGDASFAMKNGAINSIYGAMGACDVGGTLSINVSGGTVGLIVAGGAQNSMGATKIELSGDAVVTGNVYGDGWNTTVPYEIKNGVSITLKDNAKVNGIISALHDETHADFVSGEKVLKIENYTGSVNIGIFDTVNVSADSTVEFANEFKNDTLIIQNGAKITLAEGAKFDAFVINFGEEVFEMGDVVDISEIFGDSTSVVLAEIENGSRLVVLDAKENLYSVALDGTTLSISSEIPEPSTYAAIFGAAALAFAAYRRRK